MNNDATKTKIDVKWDKGNGMVVVIDKPKDTKNYGKVIVK